MIRLPVFIWLLITVAPVLSQVKDAGFWLNGTAEYNLNGSVSAELAQEFRLNENWGELGSWITDLGASYKLKGGMFKFSGHYRFTADRRTDDFYSRRHRWYLDASYHLKAKPMHVVFRTRYQSQVRDIHRSEDGKIPDRHWRNKLSLRFDLERRYSPYVSVETFTDLGRSVNDKVRWTAGLNYKVSNVHETGLFFMHQRELNTNEPVFDYILGVNYALVLDQLFNRAEE